MLGLQLTYDINVCGTRCQATQIDNIVVCTGLINENLPLTDQEKLIDLGSQAVVHLQLHTADALAHIMFAMCKQWRTRLQAIIDTFNSRGAHAIFPDHPGALKTVIRGQNAYIFDCQPQVVHPTSLGNNTCCLHQPVLNITYCIAYVLQTDIFIHKSAYLFISNIV